MATGEVVVDVDGSIATITLNRPSVLNSLTAGTVDRLRDAFDDVAAMTVVRCVVLTGAGRAFCAGQDLQDPTVSTTGSEPPEIGVLLDDHYSPLVRRIRSMPVPVVAANGVAAGGGANLALACDIVIATESAVFIQAFIKIGLIPDVAGPWTLPRLVGRARALGLAMLGGSIPAAQAERVGLIWQCVPDDDFDTTVTATAHQLSQLPSAALVATRQVIDAASTMDLDAALALEADTQDRLARADDFAEGVAAFLDKRPPHFADRQHRHHPSKANSRRSWALDGPSSAVIFGRVVEQPLLTICTRRRWLGPEPTMRCNSVLQSAHGAQPHHGQLDEAMAICLLLAEAADASADDQPLRDTWVDEARLMIEFILGRTDE